MSRLVLPALVAASTSCAAPNKSSNLSIPAPIGSSYEAVGSIGLHRGQPCTIQIMFDFRPSHSRSTVWLGAPMHESVTLTEAANHRQRVHIIGKWRRGRQAGCNYVEVASVELMR